MAIGSGWQAIVAYVNLACYYIIGLPIAYVLGFKTNIWVVVSWRSSFLVTFFLCELDLNDWLLIIKLDAYWSNFQGIWWGMITGVLLQTITLNILTARTNWNAEVTSWFFELCYVIIGNLSQVLLHL